MRKAAFDEFNPEKLEKLSDEQAKYLSPEFMLTADRIIGQYLEFMTGERDVPPETLVQYDGYSDSEDAQRDAFMLLMSLSFGKDIESGLNEAELQWKDDNPDRGVILKPWMKAGMGMSDPEQEICFTDPSNVSRDLVLATNESGVTFTLHELEFASNRLDSEGEPVPSMARIIYCDATQTN